MTARLRHNYRDHDWNRGAKLPDIIFPGNGSFVPDISDLWNDIHPIFCELNFPGARYEVLSPILQLASLLIDTDCLLDFWHAVFFGERRVVYDTADHEEWHISYGRRGTCLSAKEKAETRLKLRALGHMVRFYRDSNIAPSNGMCKSSEGDILSNMNEIGLFRQSIDCIRYNEGSYQRLCDLHDKATCTYMADDDCDYYGDYYDHNDFETDENDDGPLSRLYPAYFKFAITLVHEIAHAAVMAEMGTEAYAVFEDNDVSESGYDWEGFVFGGPLALNLWRPRDRRLTVSASWPSASMVRMYVLCDLPIWTKDPCVDAVSTRFYVSDYHIQRFFRAEFWNVTVPEMGADALKLLKTTAVAGFRETIDHSGSCVCFQPHEKDARRFDGIPEGWYAEKGFIYPIDRDDIDADGFGRLMRINIEGIWGDEEGLQYRLEFPELPKRPPA